MALNRPLAALAVVWGFAEATLFFIVPDVLVTRVALRDRAAALRAAGWAVVGALPGGALMHVWGIAAPTRARAALDAVPAISPALIDSVLVALREHGIVAALIGAFSGTPYKIYAVQSGPAGIGLPWFLIASIPVRLARFALLAVVVGLLARSLRERGGQRVLVPLWVACWIFVYAAYWASTPG